MKRIAVIAATLAVAVFQTSFHGCQRPTTPESATTSTNDHGHDHASESSHAHDADHGHGHGHGRSSTRGGQIVDLGRDHQFHDESITVYMLDSDLKDLEIDAPSISLTLMLGEEIKTFKLIAAEGDGSYFTIKDEMAFEMIETDGTEGKLRVEIDGKPFTGSFAHQDHPH